VLEVPVRHNSLTLQTYLTVQIQEIICLGPLHALTWSPRDSMNCWLQLTVQGGDEHYVAVEIRLPAGVSRRQIDRIFGQTGFARSQHDGAECVVYYLGRARSAEKLVACRRALPSDRGGDAAHVAHFAGG
jgi:hypothetical protein